MTATTPTERPMTKAEAIQELKRCFDWVPDGKRTMERILETFEADSADLTVLREKVEAMIEVSRLQDADWIIRGALQQDLIRLKIFLESGKEVTRLEALRINTLQSHDGESK